MGTTTIDRKHQVVKATATMLATTGLRGISIREIAKFANAPLGSTYHHFPGGKNQIVSDAVLWAGEEILKKLQACLAQNKEDGIYLFFADWKDRLMSNQYQRGCPIVAAAIDAHQEEDSEQIKVAVSTVFSNWEKILTEHLIELGYSSSSAETISIGIIACIEGAIVLCRGHQDIRPFDAALKCIQMLTRTDIS